MRVIMLAPPGAGKGTQSERIAARYKVPHIASGDIFREETARRTPVGERLRRYLESGDLVPDDLVLSIIMDRVVAAAEKSGGYVLDGFPRTAPQAEAAGKIGAETDTGPQAVVYLDVPTDVLLGRISNRGEHRADDSAAVTRHRLEVYTANTRPLIDYFTKRGIVIKVDGSPGVDAVSQQIYAALDRVAGTDHQQSQS